MVAYIRYIPTRLERQLGTHMNNSLNKIEIALSKLPLDDRKDLEKILLSTSTFTEIGSRATQFLKNHAIDDMDITRKNVSRWRAKLNKEEDEILLSEEPLETGMIQSFKQLADSSISPFEVLVAPDKRLSNNEILKILGLSAKEWKVLELDISAKNGRVMKPGTDKVSIVYSHSYKGKVVRIEDTVEALRPPEAAKIKVGTKKYRISTLSEWESIFVFPDQQIGYRNDSDITIHDEKAIEIAHAICESVNPTHIVNLGDFLDLAPLGRYVTEQGLMGTTQKSINRGFEELAYQREIVKDGDIIYIKGNHDKRFEDSLIKMIPEMSGLKIANSPVVALSLDHLMRFNELGIKYIDAYPGEHGAGAYWANTNTLKFQHAPEKLVSGGSSAVPQSRSGPFSTIYGHCHRIEHHFHKAKLAGNAKVDVFAASPGTLASLNGEVPGFSSSLNNAGIPQSAYNNWQHGVAVVHYKPGVAYSEYLELIHIKNYVAQYQGHIYTA